MKLLHVKYIIMYKDTIKTMNLIFFNAEKKTQKSIVGAIGLIQVLKITVKSQKCDWYWKWSVEE